ncbi:hypothetical protein V6N13_037806 [Hibiscus sabdariffa]|uniref:Uncharacterized protein n=1 Tax=Hibiscus sabdariffa TaxID=183260 RepID=A0ABR2S463_9ROSI
MGNIAFNNKGNLTLVQEFISRPAEYNLEGLEADQNRGNLSNMKAIDSKRGRRKKMGNKDLTIPEGFRPNFLVRESASIHHSVPLEWLDEAQATLSTRVALGIEFKAPRSVVLEQLVAADLEKV